MDELKNTTRRLDDLTRQLDGRQIVKVMRKVYRREAQRVKRAAARRLKLATIGGNGISNAGELGRNIMAGEMRSLEGFYVSVSPSRKRAMHKNRQGKLKPATFWLNHGVTDRHTKDRTGGIGWVRGKHRFAKSGRKGVTYGRKRPGRPTGEIAGLDFIGQVQRSELPKSAANLVKNYEKIASDIIQKAMK